MDLLLASSALVTGVAGFMSGYGSEKSNVNTDFDPLKHLQNRFKELESYLNAQEKMAKRNRNAGNLLTIGQYLVGGLLATSFLQEHLSNVALGILGLIVLFSSIIQQKFRPDLKASKAKARATKLKQLLRGARDSHNEIKLEFDGQIKSQIRAESKLALNIGKQISEIENSEDQDLIATDSIQYKIEEVKS